MPETRTGAPAPDASSVHVRLLRLFASPEYQPPVLPAVALHLIHLSKRAEVEFREVAAVVERDPLLAARVLAVSQSALLAPRAQLRSVEAAVVRLGMRTVRDLVLEAAVSFRVFRAPGYEAVLARLARHASTTAHLVRRLAERFGVAADHGFLAGLLHDVGIGAALVALADDRRAGAVPFEAVGGVLHAVHESASGLVCRLWDLAPELQRLAGSHHRLETGPASDPVGAVLVIAEALAAELGAGMEPLHPSPAEVGLDASPPELFGQACGALRLDRAALAAARVDAAEVVRTLGGLPDAG